MPSTAWINVQPERPSQGSQAHQKKLKMRFKRKPRPIYVAHDAPSPEVLKARQNGALGNLI